jgi:hypothetical protein
MLRSLTLISLFFLAVSPVSAAEFDVVPVDEGVEVRLGGQLVTRYLTKSGVKPVFWPVIGPHGDAVTRSYPVGELLPGEKKDHIHQRSFWFTHGDVNGVDFWAEEGNHGEIVHREFVEVAGGAAAKIVTRNDWNGPDGVTICQDQRSFTIASLADGAIAFDCEIVVTAALEKVVFGDTKEGSFGLRTAGTMDVDAKLGGKIVNSDVLTDGDAWGKRAAWVDYHGPVNGKTVGIAIMNHPTSFRFPTYWHVRPYGLFAANPFGVRDFTGAQEASGAHSMAKGESFTLRYRVLIHAGDEQAGQVAKIYDEYAQTSAQSP